MSASLGPDAAACRSRRCASTPSWSGAPRRPATRTSGAARPTARTGSRRWRSPPRGPSRCGSAPASSACFTRGPALLAQQAAALADASGGRFALGIGASSDRIVEGWNAMPVRAPAEPRLGDGRLPARGVRRRAHRDRLQARAGAARAGPDRARRAAREDARARGGEGATGRCRTSSRSRACRGCARRSPAPPRASSSSAASSACRASASRSSPWRGSCSPPTSPSRLRRVLSLARPRRGDRRDVRGLGGEGPRARRRGGAVGADRGDVHPRHAGADARAARAVRRRRDHAARC